MHLLCPHCHNPIELVRLDAGEIACPSCGSSFRLEGGSTTALARKTLGKFELLNAVGSGAFGTVYKARDPELDRTVAVKVPRTGNLPGGDDLGRFLREARSVAQLRHPAIVPIYEVGHSEGLPYLVSEFVEGVTLADLLSSRRPPPRDAAKLVAAIADALQYAHDQGVVHRDVKPSNVMLDGEGRPHVMDFGLAKREAGEITMTIDGQVLGTPAYMSPEQARGEGHQVDGRSDVYSLGVILYQLLTGELPFRGTTRMLLHQVLHDEPRPPRRLNDRIARDLETITLKAMAKEPARRYAMARDLANDLRRYLQGEPIQARPVGQVERFGRWCRRNPVVAGLTVAVAFLLVAGSLVSTLFAIDATWARDRADAKAREAQENAQKEAEERQRADREAATAWANQYIAHMNLLQSDWETPNVSRILDVLAVYRQPPPDRKDVRGWEWHYQERLARQELRTLTGTKSTVNCVVFRPDGTQVATAHHDGTMKLWDAGTGQELRTLRGHTLLVRHLEFSPNGEWLASVSSDRTVKLWDAASGQELRTLRGHKDAVNSVAFHPDGARLASVGSDRMVTIWDATTGELIRTFPGQQGVLWSVAFSPDGGRLASAGADGTVKLWDAASGQELCTLKRHTRPISHLAFSPDGARLASSGNDGMMKLWDVPSAQEIHTLRGHTGTVFCVAFSPDGARLASTGSDQTVKEWDAASGQHLRTLKGHQGAVWSVAFSPDGVWLASAGADWFDQRIKLWHALSGQDHRTLKGHRREVDGVAFHPDGTRLASASSDGIKVWDVVSGQEFPPLERAADAVLSVAFSPDRTRLAMGSGPTVKVWDMALGRELHILNGHTAYITSVAFSPDGTRLASASADATVKVWDAASGQELHNLKGHARQVMSVAFSPDGAQLASAGTDRTVKLWEPISGQELRTLQGHTAQVRSVAFSPDGAWLASASFDETVRVWDTASGQELGQLLGHTGLVYGVAFSPDGTRLATASSDRLVKLWDATTGQELRTLQGHQQLVKSVAFSPDGHWLASAGHDGTIRLWDARPLTPDVQAEVEAVGLLESLFAKPLPQSKVRAALQRKEIISEGARLKALQLAGRFKEETDPKKYHAAAWPVIRHPYANIFTCQFALAQMNAACERAPGNSLYRLRLGVAQYRLGRFEKERYQDALATLTKCDQNQPATLAFLTMTQYQLGQKEQARTTLAQLRGVMKSEQWTKDAESTGFLAEAEMLIASNPDKPKK